MTHGSATLTILRCHRADRVHQTQIKGSWMRLWEADLLLAAETICASPTLRACVLIGRQPNVFIQHYDLKVLSPKAAS